MNTKGIKFLAVLAVMVMAFSAVIVLAPADNDVDAVIVYNNPAVKVDPKVVTGETGEPKEFYISDDATVKIKGLPESGVTFYVQNGKELELDVRTSSQATTVGKITIFTVTGDQQRHTTSTVDTDKGENGQVDGKIKINESEVTFTALKGQSVAYKALMPKTVDTHTTSVATGKAVITNVTTGSTNYATISSDKVLTDPTIKSKVTVAEGQYVDVSTSNINNVKLKCGILVKDVTAGADANATETTLYTYFATGVNAGTFYMDNSKDNVDIINGSITVYNGTSNVKASSVKGVTVTYNGENKLTVKDKGTDGMTAGALTVAGDITFNTLIIADGAVVTVANNTTTTGTVQVDGKLNLRNIASGISSLKVNSKEGALPTGIICAQNEQLWDYGTGTIPALTFAANGTFAGLYDVSAITKSADVKDAFSTAQVENNQTFVVVGDTTVSTALTIKGVVIIQPGVTLTITKTNSIGAAVTLTGQYAQLINNGEIVIKTTHGKASTSNDVTTYTDSGLHIHGGLAENNGRIIASSEPEALDGNATFCVNFTTVNPDTSATSVNKGIGLVNNGVITTSKNDKVAFDEHFVNKKLGSLSVNGTFSASTFVNKGAFTLNNSKISDNLTIKTAAGASVNVVAAEVTKTKSIQIIDGTASVTVTSSGANSDQKVTVRGLAVVDVSSTSGGDMLTLSGSMGITKFGSSYATLAMGGQISIPGTTIIGEGYDLNINPAATVYVSGDLTIAKAAEQFPQSADAGVSPTLRVSGAVTDLGSRLNVSTKLIGAEFQVATASGTTTYYMPFEDAVVAAAEANVNSVDVGYIAGATVAKNEYPVVTKDVMVPAGLYVNGYGLVVGTTDDAPLIAVAESAGFNFNNVTVVEGMIAAANVNDVNESSIHADVKNINDDYSGTFMSLRVALAIAQPGDVVGLSQDFVTISNDLVIPEGVFVDATAIENGTTDFIVIDSNLIVNGTLIVNDFMFIATTDDTKAIVLNGTIMDKHDDGNCIAPWWYVPEGVSYNLTLPDKYGMEEVWYVITNLDNLQEAILLADDSKVAIEGSPKLGDLTIYGTEDEPAEVTFKGDVNAGTITIDNVIIKALNGNKVDATIADALGSITISGAYVDTGLSIYSVEESGVYMAGSVTDNMDGTYSIRFDGLTGIDATSKSTIGWGHYNGEGSRVPTVLFNGITTVEGKKATIENNVDTVATEGIVTVAGSLLVDNNSKIVIASDVQILGAVVAAERTEAAPAGSVEVVGDIFVGTLMDDIYDSEAAKAAYEANMPTKPLVQSVKYGQTWMVVNASAVLSGKVDVDPNYFITVMEGSVVDPAIVEDMESMDVLIDGDLWLTVYGLRAYSLDGLKAPIINAKVSTIVDAEGNDIAFFDHYYRVIYGCPTLDLGDTGVVGIVLNYEAFTVKIKTDGSVKAVYIDGILMETGENKNIFTLKNQTTGTHKVTVEPSAGYTADGCVLYTEMGTILPGMAFTFTEFDCDNYQVTYNIKGTQVEPEPVPPTPEEESQWTITTILLVILVVLIAIMAVIVALRLNRS